MRKGPWQCIFVVSMLSAALKRWLRNLDLSWGNRAEEGETSALGFCGGSLLQLCGLQRLKHSFLPKTVELSLEHSKTLLLPEALALLRMPSCQPEKQGPFYGGVSGGRGGGGSALTRKRMVFRIYIWTILSCLESSTSLSSSFPPHTHMRYLPGWGWI